MSKRGFTIVELLIVIVVIAILASISVVAYNGIQNRASDVAVRAGVDSYVKALYRWNAETGQRPVGGWSSTTAIGSGENCVDGSGGWTASGSYACSIEDILRSKNLVPANYTRSLPNNTIYSPGTTDGRFTLMFYACGTAGRYALYYHLRAPTAQDSSDVAAAESLGCTTAPRTNYGMRGAKVINL